jgi:hypothetical protein
MSNDDNRWGQHIPWWREARTYALDSRYRLTLLRRFSFLGLGLGTVGCAETAWMSSARGDPSAAWTEESEAEDAGRDLLRPWHFPGSVDTDARRSGRWQAMLPNLESHLAPVQEVLWPFYRPTLFQTLAPGQDTELRGVITPIYTSDMCRAYERGHRLLSILARKGPAADTAVVIDAPGPEAVAVAAALAASFDPVFVFDNWPHKRGVVPSHLTLAAALYFAPLLEEIKAAPSARRPPVFILDSNRLSPYFEAAADFDNRYTVAMPQAEEFRQLGIRHLLYVTGPVRPTELDDLNDDFVTLADHGIDIKLLALDDLRRAGGEQACDADDEEPYLFGGDEETDRQFWDWYAPNPGALDVVWPVWLGTRARYHPTHRPSFIGRPRPVAGGWAWPGSGPGAAAPTGSAPQPHATIPPHFGGRSGSFGRWHSSFTS